MATAGSTERAKGGFGAAARAARDSQAGLPEVVSREAWLAARKTLLAEERRITHLRDRLTNARRALPWVKVDTPYLFDSATGHVSLADLFDGRSQLFVQHFMLAPGSDHICGGCAGVADGVDAARRHFEHADLSFVAVSRAPVDRIEQVKARMGWTFRWVSSGRNSFNYDYGVSFTPEQVASGDVGYNYGTTPYAAEDLHGSSVFAKNAAGEVFHTYSTYARGGETLFAPFNYLDLVPKGRNENGTMSWLRLHDEYEDPQPPKSCCGASTDDSHSLTDTKMTDSAIETTIDEDAQPGPAEREIVVSRLLDAPRALVWKAWTEPAHIVRWWGPEGFAISGCTIDQRVGGAFRLLMQGADGAVHPCRGTFREIVAGERIVYDGEPDDRHGCGAGLPPGARVTVTLEDAGGRTRLTVHTRFATDAAQQVAQQAGYSAGWSESLQRLAGHVDQI